MLREIIVLALVLGTADGYYSGGNNNYYYNPYGKSSSQLFVCDNSVVRISYLSISCDSPYTFYYGNGANRNTETCDYGDKMTLSGTVTVVDNLQYGDKIYMSMGVYDDDSNLLVTSRPANFCEGYIGSDCTKQGTYSFETKMKLGMPEGTNRTHFYPLVQMAFSTKMDYGYNLGAANMQCRGWDGDVPLYAAWSNKNSQMAPAEEFFADNIMLLSTCFSLSLFALYVWKNAEQQDNDTDAISELENYDMEGNVGDYQHPEEDQSGLKQNDSTELYND